MVIAIYEFNNKWHHLPIRGINDFCHFFVLICSKETKTEMNTKKVAHDSPHCTLIFCTHNFNSLFYFFYTKASFVPMGYSGFQETWMIIVLVKPTEKILAKVSYPKRILESKISNPTNPSIISVTKNPEYLYWGFVPPQISLSKVLLMTYFITAKQIVDYESE